MKAKTGDVIECFGCRKPVGTVVDDISEDSKVLAQHVHIAPKTYSDNGAVCDYCNATAAFHDKQNESWTIQVRGKRVS